MKPIICRRDEKGKSGKAVTIYVFGIPVFRNETLRKDNGGSVRRTVGFCSYAHIEPTDDEYYTDE